MFMMFLTQNRTSSESQQNYCLAGPSTLHTLEGIESWSGAVVRDSDSPTPSVAHHSPNPSVPHDSFAGHGSRDVERGP